MADLNEELRQSEELQALAVAETDVAVTGGADEAMAQAVARRGLIPTERQRQEGEEDQEYAFERYDEARKSLLETAKRSIRDLNPKLIGGAKFPIVLLALSSAITDWDDRAFGLLLPEMRADFGFSLVFLGGLATALQLMSIFLAPAMGYLADRVVRVWMLRIGHVFANSASIVTGLAPGMGVLLTGRIMTGIGGSVAGPAGFPLLADYYPSSVRVRLFSFLGVAGSLGALAAGPIAGNLGQHFGWRFALVSLGALSLLITVGYFFLKEPVRGYQDRKEMGADEATASTAPPPIGWAEAWRSARSITTLRRIWYATPFLQIATGGAELLIGLYYAQEFGLRPSQRGYIGSLGVAVGMFGLLFAGPIGDRMMRFRPGRIMAAFAVLLMLNCASVLVLVFSKNLWLSIAFHLPLGLAAVALLPSLFALISMVVPARLRGLGIQTIAPWRLIGAFGPLVITIAADAWGIRRGLLILVPIWIIGALILGSSTVGVDRDIRAAKAASMADEEARKARQSGKNKMLICRDVDVTYDQVQVLFNVDFDLEEGEIVALLGTNGAGKSTLLRAIAGIQEASNGAIFLDGQDITHAPTYQIASKGVVMVPGGHAIFPTLTVEENLKTAGWMYREDEEYVKAGVERVLEFFPILRERYRQPAGNLSGGEQQMVALGQALLMKPRLLMIDELSLGLAPQIVEQLLETLRAIHREGTTIILVEQSLNVALVAAERAVFMEKGEVRFSGPTAELVRHPELIRSVFMGSATSGTGLTTAREHKRRAETAMETILRGENISVSFGGVQALNQASVDVGAGEIVGIIGPNGAGKTTLFDVISGFTQPDEGTVVIEATDVTNSSPDARARLGLGRSFQNVRLFPAMTVRENIAIALERHISAKNPVMAMLWLKSVRKIERRVFRRVDSLINLLGLRAYSDKFVNELSTGTRRTVDIACIMASEPRVLLLDEPSSGLAQAETEELGPVIQRLARETGCGILVIEHDLPLITSISDRLVAMELGSVIAFGTPDEVRNDPRVVSSYLAASDAVIQRSGTASVATLVGADGATGNGTGNGAQTAGTRAAGSRDGGKKPAAAGRKKKS